MIKFKTSHGFTLVELTVGIAVLLIILAGIVPLFSAALSMTSAGMMQNNLRQEGRWAVDIIAKELSGINISKITNPLPPTTTTPSTSHTLAFTSFNSTNSVTYSVPNGTNEVYRLGHPVTDSTRASINAPTDLTFTRNIDEISITIRLKLTQKDSKNREYTEIITTTVTPLNNGND